MKNNIYICILDDKLKYNVITPVVSTAYMKVTRAQAEFFTAKKTYKYMRDYEFLTLANVESGDPWRETLAFIKLDRYERAIEYFRYSLEDTEDANQARALRSILSDLAVLKNSL